MDLQRIHIKILSDAPTTLNLSPFLSIFGRWRHEKDHPAGWVDLADYAHVPRGAGVVLVGFQANIAFDMSEDHGRSAPGVLYSARKGLAGSHVERITSVLRSGLGLAQRLAGEKEFPPEVHLRTNALEIRFADRVETPNNKEMFELFCPPVLQVLDRLYGPQSGGNYQLTPYADQSQVLGCSVRAKTAAPLEVLLKRLG